MAAAAAAQATTPLNAADAAPAPAIDAACCRLAAGTAVELEITESINSSQRKRGDRFGLRLAHPLRIGDTIVVPSGTPAVGEVVHASAARGGGAPGELLLAARHLDAAGVQAPLRGLKLGATGGDNSRMALGVSFAAGPFAMFIRGREIEIPALTRVVAKVAADTALAQVATPESPPIESVPPTQE